MIEEVIDEIEISENVVMEKKNHYEIDFDLKILSKKPWYRDTNLIKILIMLSLVILYFFIELIVGIIANSLTLIADSFHMLSDAFGLVIGAAGIIVK
jgi:Co/Zn/Cd efflux system component